MVSRSDQDSPTGPTGSDDRPGELRQQIATGFNRVDRQLERVGGQWDRINDRCAEAYLRLERIDRPLDELHNRTDERLGRMSRRMDTGFERMNERFAQMNRRIDTLLYIQMGILLLMVLALPFTITALVVADTG